MGDHRKIRGRYQKDARKVRERRRGQYEIGDSICQARDRWGCWGFKTHLSIFSKPPDNVVSGTCYAKHDDHHAYCAPNQTSSSLSSLLLVRKIRNCHCYQLKVGIVSEKGDKRVSK